MKRGSQQVTIERSSRTRALASKWLVVMVGVMVSMCGCVAIPTAGPVVAADAPDKIDRPVLPIPEKPYQNAGPVELVQGFISASGSVSHDNFTTAREFLTSSALLQWKPMDMVTVYSAAGMTFEPMTPDHVVVANLKVEAKVDAYGQYQKAPAGTTARLKFVLEQNSDKQWRIAKLADGIAMSVALFSNVYRQVSLYFLATDKSVLLPDVRYFPSGQAAATHVVRALLNGPAAWLAGAVHPTTSGGTALALSAVPIQDGVARVDLTRNFLTTPSEEQRYFISQLHASLTQLANVTNVRLSVEGAQVDLRPVPGISARYTTGPGPLVVSNGQLVPVAGGAAAVPGVLPGSPVAALNTNATMDAWIGLANGNVVRADNPSFAVIAGEELVGPGMDRFGWVWSGEQDNNGNVVVAPPQTLQNPTAGVSLAAPWLAGTKLVSIRPSWDGTRLAIAYQDGSGGHIAVVGIVRAVGGTVAGLTGPLALGSYPSVSKAVWSSPTQVVALATGSQGAVVLRMDVGGQLQVLPAPAAVDIAAGSEERSVYVLNAQGDLLIRVSGAWRLTLSGVSQPVFPG